MSTLIFFPFLELAKTCLTKSDFDFAWTYFQWNCYTLHPEWLLLSMLSDTKKAIRKMAVDKILLYRQSEKPNGVRTRILPTLNKNAKSYHQIIGKKYAFLFRDTRLDIFNDFLEAARYFV